MVYLRCYLRVKDGWRGGVESYRIRTIALGDPDQQVAILECGVSGRTRKRRQEENDEYLWHPPDPTRALTSWL